MVQGIAGQVSLEDGREEGTEGREGRYVENVVVPHFSGYFGIIA